MEAVTTRLTSAIPGGAPMDRQDIAKLVMELMQGHEDTLGAFSPNPRPMVKLPMRHWRDVTPNGGLFVILRRCLMHKHEHKLRRFDWQSDHKRAEFTGMMRDCETDLREKGVLRRVKVCVATDVPRENVPALRAAAAALGAVLAQSQYEEGVTHILHASSKATNGAPRVSATQKDGGDPGDASAGSDAAAAQTVEAAQQIAPPPEAAAPATAAPNDAEESKCVVLGVSGKEALVHYKRYPESYDQWLSISTATQNAAPGSNLTTPPPSDDAAIAAGDHLGFAPAGVVHVLDEWLLDSAHFNEWCEERDYEWEDPASTAAVTTVEMAQLPGEAVAPGALMDGVGEKRKAQGEEQPASAKTSRGEGNECVASPRFAERVAPNVVKRQLATPHADVATLAAGDGGGGAEAVAATHAEAAPASLPGRPTKPNPLPVSENISYGQNPAAAARAAAAEALAGAAGADVARSGEDAMDVDGKEDTRDDAREPLGGEVYRIPGHAAWFRWDAVHAMEKKGLPEFFTGASASKTPAAYHAYRCAMMNQYRALAPQGERLLFTNARKGLVGDINTLQRIFDFLERWGLINWQAPTDGAGGGTASETTAAPRVVLSTVVAPATPTPGTTAAAAAALYRFPAAPSNGAAALAAAAESAAEAASADTGVRLGRPPKNPVPAPSVTVEAPLAAHAVLYRSQAEVERECASCSCALIGVGRVYYHCASAPKEGGRAAATATGQDLCGRCFTAGRLPDGTTSASFLRTVAKDAGGAGAGGGEGGEGDDDDDEPGDEWDDQETLLLLEGLELYGEAWTEVAEHVGTKSVEECIRHFIRMPIEDKFLDDIAGVTGEKMIAGGVVGGDGLVGGSTSGPSGAWGDLHRADPEMAPFGDAPNPVMANIAFLATCVGPRVAAAAARGALQALADEVDGCDDEDAKAGAREDLAAAAAALGPDAAGVTTEKREDKAEPELTAAQVRSAAATGLAAAAVRAKLLADQEEQEIQRLVVGMVEHQMRKVELKMRYFEDLEAGLNKEKEQIERMKQQIFAERAALKRQQLEAEERAAAQKAQAERRAAAAAAAEEERKRRAEEEEERKRRAVEAAAAAAAAAEEERKRRAADASSAAEAESQKREEEAAAATAPPSSDTTPDAQAASAAAHADAVPASAPEAQALSADAVPAPADVVMSESPPEVLAPSQP